jgi:hypothetical protein
MHKAQAQDQQSLRQTVKQLRQGLGPGGLRWSTCGHGILRAGHLIGDPGLEPNGMTVTRRKLRRAAEADGTNSRFY